MNRTMQQTVPVKPLTEEMVREICEATSRNVSTGAMIRIVV